MSNLTTKRKIDLLNKLLSKGAGITTQSSGNPDFKSWKNLTERTLVRIFGDESVEVKQLRGLNFEYRGLMFGGNDYSSSHKNAYNRSFSTMLKSIENYIEEFNEELQDPEENSPSEDSNGNDQSIKKVFISHSSQDTNVVEELIEILESLGLNSTQIFCSSFEGYGIDYGENFLDRIKTELDTNVLVLFVLSKNFYESPICLCEMGATWIKTNIHIPILIPPFDFSDIQGVIPLTQGFKVNDSLALNQFKDQVEKLFEIQNKLEFTTWERKRDRIINRLEKNIK
ncbi:conserved hypothetical protein [Tenacibaculum dicentrarchi]|uniref:TIR domain-containing protein n=1 Tax=Tenacibaculum dicentrarchi TaxID=669041 RepID=A0ABM9NXI4_9FLAO|nr:conserved hypothetical protein [Tenacibaculum dicentrarchi]